MMTFIILLKISFKVLFSQFLFEKNEEKFYETPPGRQQKLPISAGDHEIILMLVEPSTDKFIKLF